MAGKLDVDIEVKSPADKYWESIRNCNTLFPKVLPDLYTGIEVLEGDGKSVGSITLVKYAPQESPLVSFSKEKIEAVDEAKKSMSYSIIGGELLNYYKNFVAHLVVTPKGDGNGSLVKWTCEFEKAKEEVTDPHFIKDFAVKNLQELDAYILKA